MKRYFVTNPDPFCGVSIARLDENGIITWLGVPDQDYEYQQWLADGNNPEEWNPEGV